MNPQAGLAFEQAPPFALPLRFFLTAPLFLLAAGMLVALAPDALASRWTPQALALTHVLTLGFLAMTMMGALIQMLPVVAGSTLPTPRFVAWFSHVPVTLGTLALITGFLTAAPLAFKMGIALLAIGFTVFLAAAAISLTRAVTSVTVTGIRFAVASLGMTLMLGLTLALVQVRPDGWASATVEAAIAAHAAFGLLGWVGLLVISVAYQVVPMFQITPAYPPYLSRWLVGMLFALLLLHAAAPWLAPVAGTLIDTGLASGILLFALVTLRLQSRRRRKLPDVTLDYWRLGMASLMFCVPVWLIAQWSPAWANSDAYPLLLGVLFIGGFAVSVVCGMLYKIVPFLAWFHLQAQLQARAGSIPTMKNMIAARWMRMQFRLHLFACVLLIASVLWPPLTAAAGAALSLSAVLLWINLLSAAQRFSGYGGRFF